MTERPGGSKARRSRGARGSSMPPGRRFRMVRGFLRGYLHQDFVAEHGSVEHAFRAFLRDATPDEVRRLREEWRVLAGLTMEWDITAIVSLLTMELGGAWAPASKRELARLTRAIAAEEAE